jgi:hypothetical protein
MQLNVKSLMLVLGTGIVFSLSGCGGGSSTTTTTTTEPGLGDQTILADGSIEYVDYTGGTRIAPPSAADAEYHTGTGYGSTLFDSPKNKCMNCHNELYDTWESSMHGKSWIDPIFQSKFQDFLRTHLAKIGDDKTADGGILYKQQDIIDGDGVGGKNMFSGGAALTCIKCHAPSAYYAGDVRVTVTDLGIDAANDINNSVLLALKLEHEVNDPMGETAVIAANPQTKRVYKATFQIGHEANREGISCAFCHSIETPRMMTEGDVYTIKKALRSGPHGPIVRDVGQIAYDSNASSSVMNNFFRIWGPEKPVDYNNTSKEADEPGLRAVDGRYTMTSVDVNGTNGKVHYTGGPFYGPFGVSGKSNENTDDETNRTAFINTHFDADTNNHFGDKVITIDEAGDHAKSLCLSCHQRSAGAKTAPGQFMELCSTQMAVTTGVDTPTNDSLSSPKCQKCHMERIEGDLLHQWARPDLDFDAATFKAAVGYDLTPELDKDVNTSVIPEGEAPERDGWFNSHAFLGASKTGHKTSATAKIQSGFDGTISTSLVDNTLTVTTTFTNKTAHMFPGAHPMRRVLSRVIVTDGEGNMIDVASSTGESTFDHIENTVQPMAGKVLHSSALTPVPVNDVGSDALNFPGKVADLNGAVVSQKFSGEIVTIPGTDSTIGSQTVTAGLTTGTVANAAIVEDTNLSTFTRVYGHETGKVYDATFVVRPGFDSNTVESDNRLSPNETETYTLTYNIAGRTGVSATYKIYYMQKGANGKFLVDPATGFLNQTASDTKKLLVTEVGSYTEAVN